MSETRSETRYPITRAYPRYSFFADTEATLGDGTTVPVQLCDLSSGGCFAIALEPIPIGTGLLLNIRHGKTSCELVGEIIYQQASHGMGLFGMGVIFGEMASDQRAAIEAWLREAAEKRRRPRP